MARSLMRVNQTSALRLILHRSLAFQECFVCLDRCNEQCRSPFSRNFTKTGEKTKDLGSKGLSRLILLGKLEMALKTHQLNEAWETYRDFKRLYGFPDQPLMANLIADLSYSSESTYLRKACHLLTSLSKEKPALLKPDMMTTLAVSLARAQLPIPASDVVRLMLEKRILPTLSLLQLFFLQLVKTDVGTYLASNILVEICECPQIVNVSKSSKKDLTMPDVTIFNLVLEACLGVGSSLKCEQIIEQMSRLGITGNVHTIVIIAKIHEVNGMRDELKKFKDCIDTLPVTLLGQYIQFYECLLSLHLKFNDLDSASSLLLDLCNPSSLKRGRLEELKSISISIGSDNIKMGMKLHFSPARIDKDYVYKVESNPKLFMYKNRKILLSNKGLAKVILKYKRNKRISELSKLLLSIRELLEEKTTSCCDVIDACIQLGWLEMAHDIIEDLESEKYSIGQSSYASLLSGYKDKKMSKEAISLQRHVEKIGLELIPESKKNTCKSDLAESIIRNMNEEDEVVSPSLLHYNSSIYFFTKAKMIEDAVNAYRKLQEKKIHPNSSTFFYLISGYSSLGMYREITILWGDIKRSMEKRNSIYSRDLYEVLVLNFIHGGYFERVMEVIGFMTEKDMYLDKWCYKNEFLKLHRDLYRRLTTSDSKNETQNRRIEFVQAFRKFVGVC